MLLLFWLVVKMIVGVSLVVVIDLCMCDVCVFSFG